jgi:hypothetical protein
MRKTRNSAPTNIEPMFDIAPYVSTPLHELPVAEQAEMICGCGFYGLKAAGVSLEQVTDEPVQVTEGVSVSLKKRAEAFIKTNKNITHRNRATGRSTQSRFDYNESIKRQNGAHQEAWQDFLVAFGFDEMVKGGMSRADAINLGKSEFADYDRRLGGTGNVAEKRSKFTEVQNNILNNL